MICCIGYDGALRGRRQQAMPVPDTSSEGPDNTSQQIPVLVLDHWRTIIGTIPMPPASFGDIARSANEDREPQEWANLISADPVLGGKILSVVNSAAMGLIKPMTDLKKAVIHLGGHITRMIVVTYFVEGLLARWEHYPKQHFEYIRKWSACAAVLAYHFSRIAKRGDPGTLSTAALLSRLGSFVLALEWPGPRAEYIKQPDELARLNYELATWRISSLELGGMTTEHWGLPDPSPDLVKRHLAPLMLELKPSDEHAELILLCTAVVLAANYIADAETSLDKVLYVDAHASLLGNLEANRLLEAVSRCWDLKQLQKELAAIAE
jgi:HD-like signal output (HDOD) protein